MRYTLCMVTKSTTLAMAAPPLVKGRPTPNRVAHTGVSSFLSKIHARLVAHACTMCAEILSLQ